MGESGFGGGIVGMIGFSKLRSYERDQDGYRYEERVTKYRTYELSRGVDHLNTYQYYQSKPALLPLLSLQLVPTLPYSHREPVPIPVRTAVLPRKNL